MRINLKVMIPQFILPFTMFQLCFVGSNVYELNPTKGFCEFAVYSCFILFYNCFFYPPTFLLK
jgi:hypothetical protein